MSYADHSLAVSRMQTVPGLSDHNPQHRYNRRHRMRLNREKAQWAEKLPLFTEKRWCSFTE